MLILASASPRRHELLLQAGIEHAVRPTDVSEDRLPNESPIPFVQRIAEKKARAAAGRSEDTILGADTIVVVNGDIFGKPVDAPDARRMLRTLSGIDHHVYTGICLLSKDRTIIDVSDTRVRFSTLSDEEIDLYVRSREPFDKAGAYGIQGLASKFVTSIEGCYHNVVGLPLSMVYSYLKLNGNIS
jgi:nucleoside triphosphate pyrophosphatase